MRSFSTAKTYAYATLTTLRLMVSAFTARLRHPNQSQLLKSPPRIQSQLQSQQLIPQQNQQLIPQQTQLPIPQQIRLLIPQQIQQPTPQPPSRTILPLVTQPRSRKPGKTPGSAKESPLRAKFPTVTPAISLTVVAFTRARSTSTQLSR